MLISGILVSSWIILFNRYYTFLFSIVFIFVFIMEIYIDFISISTYLSLPWFHRNNNQLSLWSYSLIRQNHSLLSREYISETSNIQLQNQIRHLMFIKIQNLFKNTKLNSDNNNKYSLFDYRCPICLNNKQYSFRWIALGCGHILCSLCIQHLYFGNKPICPYCRSSIILSDLTILYI